MLRASHVVEESTRGCDHDVNTATESADLWMHTNATIDGNGTESGEGTVRLHSLFHLERKLTRRSEYQRADGAPFPPPVVPTVVWTLGR